MVQENSVQKPGHVHNVISTKNGLYDHGWLTGKPLMNQLLNNIIMSN